MINWEDQAQDSALDLAGYGLDPNQRYYAREFWRGSASVIADGRFDLGSLPAHATALCAVRPLADRAPQYLGSDLHISQGLEVETWEALPQGLRLSIRRPGHVHGKIWVRLPRQPEHASCNGTPVQFELSGKSGCIQLDAQATATIQLDW